jgi:hypothetical protein
MAKSINTDDFLKCFIASDTKLWAPKAAPVQISNHGQFIFSGSVNGEDWSMELLIAPSESNDNEATLEIRAGKNESGDAFSYPVFNGKAEIKNGLLGEVDATPECAEDVRNKVNDILSENLMPTPYAPTTH